jgi:pimeloyl-ACP methyl ester carboxylesterase
MRRGITWILVAVVLLVVVFYVGGGLYFASRINSGALAVQQPLDKAVEVVDVSADEITLRERADDIPALELDATYGLAWDGGHGEISGPASNISGSERTQVTRSFRVAGGTAPSEGGTVRVDRDVYPEEDPAEALGTRVREVEYSSPAGAFGAWYVPGRGRTWVIFTHGAQGSDRYEALRAMQTTIDLRLPSLAIEYRNDQDVPQDPSARYQYGRTEWRDLEGAVRYALTHGAAKVVLVGYSMGGAITASFLEHSSLSSKVSKVVLDSPMMDLSSTIDYGAEQLELPVMGAPPTSLVGVAKQIAAVRYDVDWEAVDYLSDPSWLTVPALVFQGEADLRVPAETAKQLRAAKPDLVTLVEVEDAGHIEAWNKDPQAYDRELTGFLTPP